MLHKILHDYDIILASGSPRRKEIFAMLGIPFTKRVSDVAEPITNEAPEIQVMKHAVNKAKAVCCFENELIVAADTIVVLDGEIFGKPDSETMAYEYLRKLSGRSHLVYSGLAVLHKGILLKAYETSEVFFSPLSDMEILDYIATKEPMDKAGAYGIQGFGSQFIHKIDGCYFNVMGFPISCFYNTIKKLDEARR